MRVSFYFGAECRIYFMPQGWMLSECVITLDLPEDDYTFSEPESLICSGWFTSDIDVSPFLLGSIAVMKADVVIFVTPREITVLPRHRRRTRANYSFPFTSSQAEIQAAVDRYGQAGLAALHRELGQLPPALFDPEGGWREN